MNIGEASAVTTLVEHLTAIGVADDYPDDVVLAVVDLNERARKVLGADAVLPPPWRERRDSIVAARRTAQRSSPTIRRT